MKDILFTARINYTGIILCVGVEVEYTEFRNATVLMLAV